MDSCKIGMKIADLRKERGYTQDTLAKALNVSNKTVSRWETGTGFPEISMLPQLSKLLGTSIDELLASKKIEKQSTASMKKNVTCISKIFSIVLMYEVCTFAEKIGLFAISKFAIDQKQEITIGLSMVGLVITLTTIVFGLVELVRAKRENNKVSAWLSGAWTFSIFFTSVYRVSVKLFFFGLTNAKNEALEMEASNISFSIMILNILFTIMCAWVSYVLLKNKKIKIGNFILFGISILFLSLQITNFFTKGKFYSVFDFSVIVILYLISVMIVLRRENENEK